VSYAPESVSAHQTGTKAISNHLPKRCNANSTPKDEEMGNLLSWAGR
jgi:hypothetical protein